MDIKDAIANIKQIYMSDSSLNVLMDFERVLDEVDIYAFSNWEKGELVMGPKVEKYWVTCSFMWPFKLMPDPRGAERLVPFGCKVTYPRESIKIPVDVEADPLKEKSKKITGKFVPIDVWIVNIQMPQELITDIEQGSIEIAGEEIDMEDIQTAYQQGIDQEVNKDKEDAGSDQSAPPMDDPMASDMENPDQGLKL